jgi:hypothetical protein
MFCMYIQYTLSPNLDDHKKCIAIRLGVIYDSRATNRKQGGLPVRAPPPPQSSYWLFGESCTTSSRPEYTKTPPQTGGSSYILIEKSSKTTFFWIKTFNKTIF